MDETRILTDDESRRRRAEQASSAPGAAVSLCAWRDCQHLASYGPFCRDHHYQLTPVDAVAARDLTATELAHIRADVEAKAAPLFLLAMDWLVRGQLANLGIPELAGPVTISRQDESVSQ